MITTEFPTVIELARAEISQAAHYMHSIKDLLAEPSRADLRQRVSRGAALRLRPDFLYLKKQGLLPTYNAAKFPEESRNVMRLLLLDWIEGWKERIAYGFEDGVPRRIGSVIYTSEKPGILPVLARYNPLFELPADRIVTAIVSWNGQPVSMADYLAAQPTSGVQPLDSNLASQLLNIDNGVIGWSKINENTQGLVGVEARHALNIEDTRSTLGI